MCVQLGPDVDRRQSVVFVVDEDLLSVLQLWKMVASEKIGMQGRNKDNSTDGSGSILQVATTALRSETAPQPEQRPTTLALCWRHSP